MGWEVEWFTYYGDTVVDGTFQIEHSAIFTKPIASTDRYMAGYHSSLNIEDKTKTKSVWGATHILTQGEDLLVSAPAKVINDRTLVGIRDLADCMYADAQWDAETKTVAIKTTPTEQLPQYNEILANVASVKNQEQQEMPETKPTLTIEEEQRQRTEKYAAKSIHCNILYSLVLMSENAVIFMSYPVNQLFIFFCQVCCKRKNKWFNLNLAFYP